MAVALKGSSVITPPGGLEIDGRGEGGDQGDDGDFGERFVWRIVCDFLIITFNFNKSKHQMFKFATSALFATSAMAVHLQGTGARVYRGPPGSGDRPTIYERVELIHQVIDQNNDTFVSISELAEMLILAEAMAYIDHETAKDIAYVYMHLHAAFGDEITVEEITEHMESLEFPEDHEEMKKISQAIEFIEFMIFYHGLVMDFIAADKDHSGYIS